MTAQDSKLYRCPKWKTCGLRCIPNHAVSPHVEVDSCSGTARGCPACVPVTKPKLDKIKEIADEASAKNERDFVHSNSIQPVISKPENPEPELTPEPEQVTALEPTQTKRLIAGGFNQGAKSQLLRSQIELPAIKIYWYNKGFEAGSKPRVSAEQIADALEQVSANHFGIVLTSRELFATELHTAILKLIEEGI